MARDDISFLNRLRHLIQTHPIIDHHAHNILCRKRASDYAKYPFESITSEERGAALDNVHKTLPHRRAVKQLAELFGCPADADWEDIRAARDAWVQRDYDGLVKRCLEGTHTLLLDDLLGGADDVQPAAWHDQFTATPTKRVVRIEELAAQILALKSEVWEPPEIEAFEKARFQGNEIYGLYGLFISKFKQAIRSALEDPHVVAFKSIICYRTGLGVNLNVEKDKDALIKSSFAPIVLGEPEEGGNYRIADKPLNDTLVMETLRLLSRAKKVSGISKPIQFHTGLGDADLNLLLSNPAHLQPLISAFPEVDFVLLHASYPYTREAGYLASVYPNVYLDLGLVFPMVSRDAQESIVRQSLEIVPTNRLLWSTDGHFFPETYWLANRQFREALEKVFVDYMTQGDFTVEQAMDIAADILFNNSNKLYALDQKARCPSVTLSDSVTLGTTSSVTIAVSKLNCFMQDNPDIEFIWMQFVDYTATVRVRMFPVREFAKIVRNERRIGITLAARFLLQDDMMAPGGSAAGQFYMEPDLSSLCRNVAVSSKSATVMSFWRSEDGDELEGCPRTMLQNVVNRLKADFGIDITCGFEMEIVFLKPIINEKGESEYAPLLTNHSWSNMTSETRSVIPLLEEIYQALSSIGIYLEQFHAESSPGQFEFILPPNSSLAAVDTLIKARQTITHIAEKHGLRATLYPRPYPTAAGTASHAHISISPTTHEETFLAGLLEHLPAVAAFTLSQDISYARVASRIWAGSEWVAWGTQNRETPIRKICPGHWEVKCLDGLANMYFAMAALLAAGYLGVSANKPLTLKDCPVDAATRKPTERSALGITTPLPKTLAQSLANLENDKPLQNLLGTAFVENYTAVKSAESAKLAAMDEEERRKWLVERY